MKFRNRLPRFRPVGEAVSFPRSLPAFLLSLFLFSSLAHAQVGALTRDANGKIIGTQPAIFDNYGQLQIKNQPVVEGTHTLRNYAELSGDEIDARLSGKTAGTTTQNLYSSLNNTTHTYTRSTTHFLYGVDLTSAAVNVSSGTFGCAAVSPRHIIFAYHTGMTTGNTVWFQPATGAAVSRTLSAVGRVGTTDISVGVLSSDLPASITPARVMRDENLFGAAIVRLNQTQQLHVADITAFGDGTTGNLLAGTDPTNATRHAFYSLPISGDSGSPYYALMDGRAVLIGCTEGVNTTSNLPKNFTAINAKMTELGGGYQLTPMADGYLPFRNPVYGTQARDPVEGDVVMVRAGGEIDANLLPSITPDAAYSLVSSGNAMVLSGFEDGTLSIGSYIELFDFVGGAPQKAAFRTALGATTVGANLFTLTNPSAITFPKINADNTVTAESAATHRTSSGATTVGANLFTLTNPSAITFPKINADNTVTAESASTHRSSLQVSDAGNVKVYRALLTQSGTSAPTATVLENSFGATLVWARSSTGRYTATLASAFTVSKTWVMPTPSQPDMEAYFLGLTVELTSTSVVTLVSGYIDPAADSNAVALADELLNGTPIEIRVYP